MSLLHGLSRLFFVAGCRIASENKCILLNVDCVIILLDSMAEPKKIIIGSSVKKQSSEIISNAETLKQKYRERAAAEAGGKPEEKPDSSNDQLAVTDEHKIDITVLFARKGVDPERGLRSEKVDQLLEEYGYNKLTPPKRSRWYVLFFKELTAFFSLMLWAGAILCFIA